jgi:hypothetical protein
MGSCETSKKAGQDVLFGAGIVGTIVGLSGLIYGGTLVADWSNPAFRAANPGRRPMTLGVLYGVGIFSLALGGLAVGIQATQQADCSFPSECQGTYVVGGTSMGAGAILVALGIYVSATPQPAYTRRAFILPMPMALPGARGPVPGIGVSGIQF